jgi:hypothetical protein
MCACWRDVNYETMGDQMKTTVKEFHSMRGHVADGCVIVSPSGKEFTLKNTIKGWNVVGPDGQGVSGNLNSAFEVECFVVNGLQTS